MRILHSSIGLKLVMAITGVGLSLFVLAHMLGNLQVFQGEEAINGYGELLHKEPAILWTARLGLLTMVGLHIYAFIALTKQNQRTRPVGYRKHQYKESTYASRTMKFTGPLVLAFIVFHILHLTTGNTHPKFVEGQVYENLRLGFQVVPVALFYLLALAALGFHLWHGVWSMFVTLGLNQPRYDSLGRRFATGFTVIVILGFSSIPLAFLAGALK